jgi:hypothetical protein
MNPRIHTHDADIIEQAMTAFLLDSASAKSKHKKIKVNMECRRRLEIKREQQRLAREISEFDFN